MFFKFARETLFPSPSPHLVRTQEVHILHRFLAPQAESVISIPMTLWKYLNHTATLQSHTELCVGGHVFRIAEHLGVVEPVAFSERFAASTTLHEQCLVRAGFIYVEPLRWRYLKDRTIPLPSNQLPPLVPNTGSYLIDGNVPQYMADPPLQPPPRPRGLSIRDQPSTSARASASTAPDDEDSEEESEVMSSLGRIESSLQQVLTTQAHHTARLDHLEQDFQRAAHPWYDFAYRSGMVSEGMATPSWYPRHDNYYEVSLSHGFDRLRVGRRRFNNFTPPAPRAPMEGDYGMDLDEEQGGGDEQVDPGNGGFFADE